MRLGRLPGSTSAFGHIGPMPEQMPPPLPVQTRVRFSWGLILTLWLLCFVASAFGDDHKVSACKLDSPKFTAGIEDTSSGHPVQDQTFVRIAYDAKYIYVCFDCRDSQPDKVMARETIRDSKYQNQSNGETEDN